MSCCDRANLIKTDILNLNMQIAELILKRQKKVDKYEATISDTKFYFYSEYRDFYMIKALEEIYETNDLKLIKPIFESIIKNSAYHRNFVNKLKENSTKNDNLK
jgi:hypothetical protein